MIGNRDGQEAVLLLESGRAFWGTALGAEGEVLGEAVFNTSMTGYQEILTDPSYAGQIVVMTASHIGNTGVNGVDIESERPACRGFAVREASLRVSNWRANGSLSDYLRTHDIVGIEGIDTRALTRALREGGAQRCAIATLPQASPPSSVATSDGDASDHTAPFLADLLQRVRCAPEMVGRDLASEVSCRERYTWPPDKTAHTSLHVVAYDFGIKRNILRKLHSAGCRVTVLPAHASAREALALAPDGLFLSNGPGDPAAVTYAIDTVRQLVDSGKPVFGICLGHQILALALGARTYKLRFGHHGGNHPVRDLATGKVEITAQNHGFAVDGASLPTGVCCTHINLYDDTVEGIRLDGRPVFSLQYHPEASPGPHDADAFFDRFVEAMTDVE